MEVTPVSKSIEGHIEFKHAGQWHHWRPVDQMPYDAEVVAKLMSFPFDKLPDDLSFTTRFDYERRWAEDAHTVGYIADSEFTLLYAWLQEFMGPWFHRRIVEGSVVENDARPGHLGYFFGNYVDTHIQHPQDHAHLELESVRFVFWVVG